jgi:hypothetical protein
MANAYSATTVFPADVCAATSTEWPDVRYQNNRETMLRECAHHFTPASKAFIAVCWKGSILNGYSLAGGPEKAGGGRWDPSIPSGQATSCVQDFPSHSTKFEPTGRAATLQI